MRSISFDRVAGNLALASATVLILFLAAETVSRIAYRPENLGSVICFDSTLGWRLQANVSCRSVDHQRRLDYLIETNSLGLRETEVPLEKPAGQRRILLIGDSVTFGTGVDASWRFSDFMQRALGDKVKVINAGVPGWGTDQELLFYETTACKLEPDIVILTFTMANDVVNNALARLFLGTAPKPRFTVEAGSLRLVNAVKTPGNIHPPLWKSFARHSRFLLFVKRRLDRWVYIRHAHIAGEMGGAIHTRRALPEGFRAETAGDLTHWSAFESPPSAVIKDAWSVTEALIVRFARICREHDATLVVFALPPRIQVDIAWREGLLARADLDSSAFDFYGPFERLSSCCLRNRIPFVYPYDEFSHAFTRRALYHPEDSHPNRYGHALAARALLEYLDENQNMHFVMSARDRGYIGQQ
jgi:lysophospholipase L1-like esterase